MKKLFAVGICIMVICSGCAAPVSSVEDGEPTVDSFKSIAGGGWHSLAVKEDGSLWSWGSNEYGQLGDGTTTSRSELVKIMDGVIFVAAGFAHNMAIKADGSLWSWGSNEYGQLGDGTYENSSKPIKIMDEVISVAAGGAHSIAIKEDGTLWAWGLNNHGQIGVGTTTKKSAIPAKVMEGAAFVTAGKYHSISIKTDGDLWIWGLSASANISEQRTGMESRSEPIKIMDDAASAAVGESYNTAIKADGSLWSWGFNEYGRPGDIEIDPVKIMDGVTSVVAGFAHSMAVKLDGSLWSWGDNEYGQLGDGTTKGRSDPVKIMDGVAFIAAGEYHSLAIKEDGSLWGWGGNWYGQLGDNTETSRNTPSKIVIDVNLSDSEGINDSPDESAQESFSAQSEADFGNQSDSTLMAECTFVTASESNRTFVRKEADAQSEIIFSIEANDIDIKLKGMGEKKLVEAYEWYKVVLPDGGIGWVREDVVVEDGDPKPFTVGTGTRYYYYNPEYIFSMESDAFLYPLDISIRMPIVSQNTKGADAINARIKDDFKWMVSACGKLLKNDFSDIDEYNIAYYKTNYNVHQYKDLYALFIETWCFGANWGGDYGGKVYYYDGKTNQLVDAETYAEMLGYSKEDIISAQNKNAEDYYPAERFEDILFYVNNEGKLFTTVGFAD